MKRKKYFLDIGLVIKVGRTKKRLTQKELAKKIGISSNYLSLIENRERYPSEDVLKKIAKELETTPDRLIEEAKKIFKEDGDSELSKLVREILTQVNIEDLKRVIEKISKEL